ncbi:PH domain-containing protein [Enterococcus gilvus]|uniref:PH domain-containing protein n=1 Tax=Enterococcus gilvus TaxID=160453 RepID=UPI0028D3F86D|nr:PH domain-containing protein [Enterococcus gilvus]
MVLDTKNKKIMKQVKPATEHLEPNEMIHEGVFGTYETKSLGNDTIKNGVFLATDKRLFFYGKRTFGFDSESFPYNSISSFEFSKKAMGYKISFYASGNKVDMKWINMGDVDSFVSFVKMKMNEKNEPILVPKNESSAIEKVKEFKELLDMGIITLDEFESKKKELLDL